MNYDMRNELNNFFNKRDEIKRKKNKKFLLIFLILWICIITIASFIFMFMFNISWIDAIYAASLIMTGIDIEVIVTTDGQKIFIIIYSFLVIFLLLSMANLAILYLFEL